MRRKHKDSVRRARHPGDGREA